MKESSISPKAQNVSAYPACCIPAGTHGKEERGERDGKWQKAWGEEKIQSLKEAAD